MMKFLNTLLFSGLAVASTQPNILFILTDDQDKHMGSPDYMPQLQVSTQYTIAQVLGNANWRRNKSSKKEPHSPNTTAQQPSAAPRAPTSGPAACPITPTSPT